MEERSEKEHLDTKIKDLTKAYKTATAAQGDQQLQIMALHSQVCELWAMLSTAESEHTLLQNAHYALQAELEGMGTINTNKISTGLDFQRLQLKKQDLERSLVEQEDHVNLAFDWMKQAEAHANECQVELDKIRVENSELE
jgi:myosin heavy chain 9/10/11/14